MPNDPIKKGLIQNLYQENINDTELQAIEMNLLGYIQLLIEIDKEVNGPNNEKSSHRSRNL